MFDYNRNDFYIQRSTAIIFIKNNFFYLTKR